MRHLASAQYWDRPACGNTGHLFLMFGRLVYADQISNCPLDRVLTYKKIYAMASEQSLTDQKTITFRTANGSGLQIIGFKKNVVPLNVCYKNVYT